MIRRSPLDQRVVVGVVFVAGMFVTILDTTIVIVALPSMARDFNVGTSSIEWVITGYLLSLAVWIPASGWVGDRFGTKRIYLLALAVFTAASALCGLASSVPELVFFRILQGVGGGMLTPVGTAMLFRAFPPEQRARANSVLIIPTVIAPATGPVLGGLLVDTLSWRWVFYVNVPIGAVVWLFGARFLREHREPTAGRFDGAGFVLSALGLGAFLYALSQAPTRGWLSPAVVVSLLVGTLGCVALVMVELRIREPMLRLSLFRDRLFATTNLVGMLAYGSFLGTLFVVPLYLQDGRGTSALVSGLSTFPEAIGVMVSAQLAARIYPRVGPRRLLIGGLLGTSAVLVSLALSPDHLSLWVFRALIFLLGASMAYVFISLQTATFSRMSSADTGHASAIYNAQRQVAAAVGVAILATVVATFEQAASRTTEAAGHSSSLAGFHAAFFTAAVIALVGAVVSSRVHDQDAAATMRRGPVEKASETPETSSSEGAGDPHATRSES